MQILTNCFHMRKGTNPLLIYIVYNYFNLKTLRPNIKVVILDEKICVFYSFL